MSIYNKIKAFKTKAKIKIGEKSDKEILRLADHICREKEGTRKYLTEEERVFKDFLFKEGYCAKTIVFWFRFLDYPRFIQERIRSDEISLRYARKIYKDYKIKTDKQIEDEIKDNIRAYFDNIKLKEFIDERLDNVRRQ
jgi:hypothetical protein